MFSPGLGAVVERVRKCTESPSRAYVHIQMLGPDPCHLVQMKPRGRKKEEERERKKERERERQKRRLGKENGREDATLLCVEKRKGLKLLSAESWNEERVHYVVNYVSTCFQKHDEPY